MIDMDASPPNNTSLNPPVDTDMRVEEDAVGADGNISTEG